MGFASRYSLVKSIMVIQLLCFPLQNIVFLLSCVTGSEAHRVISRRDDVMQLELKPLELLDKSSIVKHNLSKYGKELDESPFNNQVGIMKC